MDYENEKLLKLIFPHGVPGKCFSNNLDIPFCFNSIVAYHPFHRTFYYYLEHLRENPELLPQIYKLGSLKVDQIKKEESRLTEDNRAVVEQTQDLAITNYKTFIQTSECSRRIYTEFKETEHQLDQLTEKLPNLTETCEKFIKTSSEIAASRRLNSLTLRRNAQLLEILELPQLMDTCIFQGKYEEALELAAHVQRMGTKHGDIPVINVSRIILIVFLVVK